MKRKSTDKIVIHCSATSPKHPVDAARIDQWHRERGWNGIGYHLVICRDGVVEEGRPLGDVGAHVKGHNRTSVGVCLIGGVNDNGEPEYNFTFTQFRSLRRVLDFLLLMYPYAEILGHRDLSPDIDGDGIIEEWEWMKACPSFNVVRHLEEGGVLDELHELHELHERTKMTDETKTDEEIVDDVEERTAGAEGAVGQVSHEQQAGVDRVSDLGAHLITAIGEEFVEAGVQLENRYAETAISCVEKAVRCAVKAITGND